MCEHKTECATTTKGLKKKEKEKNGTLPHHYSICESTVFLKPLPHHYEVEKSRMVADDLIFSCQFINLNIPNPLQLSSSICCKAAKTNCHIFCDL